MDPIIKKHKYGNYTTMPNRQDGFPLDQECLSMEQNNIRLLVVLASLVGEDYVILSGCGYQGARQPGYVYIKGGANDLIGEIYYYDGSAPTSNNLHIVSTDETVTANTVTYTNAYSERYIAGGAGSSGSDTYSWSSFKKMTLKSLENMINGQSSRLTYIEQTARNALTGANPIGTIQMYAGSTAPEGWLFCRGQSETSAAYPELATVLGVTTSTFTLPDMRGRFPVGFDSSKAEFNQRGKTGGAKEQRLSTSNLPYHTHATTSSTYYVGKQGTGNPDGSMDNTTIGAGGSYPRVSTSTSNLTTGGAGSSSPTAVPTLPPYYTINFIIRAK